MSYSELLLTTMSYYELLLETRLLQGRVEPHGFHGDAPFRKIGAQRGSADSTHGGHCTDCNDATCHSLRGLTNGS